MLEPSPGSVLGVGGAGIREEKARIRQKKEGEGGGLAGAPTGLHSASCGRRRSGRDECQSRRASADPMMRGSQSCRGSVAGSSRPSQWHAARQPRTHCGVAGDTDTNGVPDASVPVPGLAIADGTPL